MRTDLPKYEVVNGEEVLILYGVEEIEVKGYETEIGELKSGKITVTNTQKTTEVEVENRDRRTEVRQDYSYEHPEDDRSRSREEVGERGRQHYLADGC